MRTLPSQTCFDKRILSLGVVEVIFRNLVLLSPLFSYASGLAYFSIGYFRKQKVEKAKLDAKIKKYSTLINDNHKKRMELQETENRLVS